VLQPIPADKPRFSSSAAADELTIATQNRSDEPMPGSRAATLAGDARLACRVASKFEAGAQNRDRAACRQHERSCATPSERIVRKSIASRKWLSGYEVARISPAHRTIVRFGGT
jgi:hypothetical protein